MYYAAIFTPILIMLKNAAHCFASKVCANGHK
ncbi:MAG: hypothetical protein JWP81_1536 [Ferruginibacter sp.]|nr:hypothetical protein [Ferruginibacter sp.]